MVGRSARARLAMATARRGSAPGSRAWSASNRASSRSTATPLAWLSRSITRTSRYWAAAASASPRAARTSPSRATVAGRGSLDHGRDRPGGVAEQLAGVRDPGQAALGRLAVDHRLGGDHGRLVAAQLDLGVEDDPEGVGQVRVGLGGPGAPGQGGAEVVAAQVEQA